MKKNVLTLLFCIGAMLAFKSESGAQTLIHYWNFNVDSADALTPTSSLVAGAGLSYSGAYYDTVQSGTTLNGVGADGTTLGAGAAALRLRNPASGPFTITIPTTGYKNIVLAYAVERTKKGSQQNIVTYTVDGTTWINTAISASATYYVDSTDTVSNAFQLETFNFSSDTLTNNNPHFKVQINFAIGDTGTSGNDRYDNITVYADSVTDTSHSTTAIASVSQVTTVYTLFPNPVVNNIDITGTAEGTKWVNITDAAGQTVYKGIQSGKQFSINTASFATGNYYINIREKNTGQVTPLKFVKQ